MPDLLIAHPPGYEAERRYIHDVVFGEFLGLSYEARPAECAGVRITSPLGSGTVILPDRLFQTAERDWLTRAALPRLPLARTEAPGYGAGAEIPVIYGDAGPFWRRTDAGLALSVDVLGSAFFMLTRYEEAIAGGPRDNRGRFPDEAALAIRAGFARRPIVNDYVAMLACALRVLWPGLPYRERRFRAYLTHDVDWPLATAGRRWPRVARQAAIDILRRHSPADAMMRLRSYRQTRTGDDSADMWNTFDFIMTCAERAGLRASFYLIPERLAGKLDGSRAIDDPFMRRLVRQIDARGHEVGLHTSYEANRDSAVIARQLALLRRVLAEEGIKQEVQGGRQHYLRWLNPETWQGWEDAGLSLDSSVGWVRRTGFRAGTCYEFPVFNLRTRRALRLRERPLLVMEEAALAEHQYQLEDATRGIVELIRTVHRYGGDFVLLWHNNWLGRTAEQESFRAVVEELRRAAGSREGARMRTV